MRLFSLIGVILALLNVLTLQVKGDWDTFYKHTHLIKSQAVTDWRPCAVNTDVIYEYREAVYNITIKTFKRISAASNSHFAYSPYSLWLILAAMSEGSTGETQEELFNFLLLPEDECLRNQQYQFASTFEPASEDVKLTRSNLLILDDDVSLNSYWENFLRENTLLRTSSAPIKADPPRAAKAIRSFFNIQLPVPNFDGNSVLFDTLDYEGLWSHAFSDAITERAPFFDDDGKQTGYVDMMKIKIRVRMAYIPAMNARVLELPVGFGGRYRMLFAVNLGKTNVRGSIPKILDSVFYDIVDGLKESIIPLDIAIPRLRMTTEIDMRHILEDMGVRALWNDVEGTRNISEPAALPSSFIQRTTITLDSTGVRAPLQEISNIVPATEQELDTGLDPILGRDFILNRPFMFGLFESKTYTSLLSATFSKPTYSL